jgi:uncharacterized membrane protein
MTDVDTRGTDLTVRALQWLTLAIAVAGFCIAAYLTYEHFSGSTSLACPDTGRINCAKVTSSQYSTVLGVPVAVLGLLFFATMIALMSPQAWRSRRQGVTWSRWIGVTLGLLFVFYLVWAELYQVGSICLWCTAVHALTFVLFVIVLFPEALREG